MGLTPHPQNELLALPSFQNTPRAGGISSVRAQSFCLNPSIPSSPPQQEDFSVSPCRLPWCFSILLLFTYINEFLKCEHK